MMDFYDFIKPVNHNKTTFFALMHFSPVQFLLNQLGFVFEFFSYHMQYRLILFQRKYNLNEEFLLINIIIKSHFKNL